eukprot:7949216-Lingulodinium_polyedra.AAC.1
MHTEILKFLFWQEAQDREAIRQWQVRRDKVLHVVTMARGRGQRNATWSRGFPLRRKAQEWQAMRRALAPMATHRGTAAYRLAAQDVSSLMDRHCTPNGALGN